MKPVALRLPKGNFKTVSQKRNGEEALNNSILDTRQKYTPQGLNHLNSFTLVCRFIYVQQKGRNEDKDVFEEKARAMHRKIITFFEDALGCIIDFGEEPLFSYNNKYLKDTSALFDITETPNNRPAERDNALMAQIRRDNSTQRLAEKNVRKHGVKVIIIRPDGYGDSNAEQGGVVANINAKAMIGYNNAAYSMIDKVPQHEVCHLFGLSDRYQFLFNYTKDANGCITILPRSASSTPFIPVYVNPAIDTEVFDDYGWHFASNLMFTDPDGKTLTTYQKNIIKGTEQSVQNVQDAGNEPDYPQLRILKPMGKNIYSSSRNTDLYKPPPLLATVNRAGVLVNFNTPSNNSQIFYELRNKIFSPINVNGIIAAVRTYPAGGRPAGVLTDYDRGNSDAFGKDIYDGKVGKDCSTTTQKNNQQIILQANGD